MIVTLTANPSLDRTLALDHALVPGGVQRVSDVTDEPGGKGVNVSRAVTAAGRETLAVLPARAEDPLLLQLRQRGLRHHPVAVEELVRVNLTVTDPDGTTTKINLAGSPLTDDVRDELAAVLVAEAATARWVVLSGSLPPDAPAGWYAELVDALRVRPCKVAVDTSGKPLQAVVGGDGGGGARPHLLKPNAEELAEALGLEPGSGTADPVVVARHARRLVDDGTETVLVTMGADGAVLVTGDGAWHAAPPPVRPRSTVGAGDCALAGYLLADLDDAAPVDRLRLSVAYGTAAAGLPGSAVPRPHQVATAPVATTPISL